MSWWSGCEFFHSVQTGHFLSRLQTSELIIQLMEDKAAKKVGLITETKKSPRGRIKLPGIAHKIYYFAGNLIVI